MQRHINSDINTVLAFASYIWDKLATYICSLLMIYLKYDEDFSVQVWHTNINNNLEN